MFHSYTIIKVHLLTFPRLVEFWFDKRNATVKETFTAIFSCCFYVNILEFE